MTESQIATIAGEHYVAHKVAMLGFVPALVRQRGTGFDLLVSSGKNSRTVGVLVKSSFNATREVPGESGSSFHLRFPLGHRAVTSTDDSAIFCFIDLRQQSPMTTPDVYVLPADVLKKQYEGTHLRRYSQVHHERPWHAMQLFRNNWEPLVRALSVEDATEAARLSPNVHQFDAFARYRTSDAVRLPMAASFTQ